MMWILILTAVLSSNSNRGGVAVSSVPGYTSEASCMAAANAWIKQPAAAEYTFIAKSALCTKA